MIPRNIVILHQEISEYAMQDELDVLVQAEEIRKVLENRNIGVTLLPADKNFRFIETLQNSRDFFVFNLVETFNGSGRNAHIVPLILEQMKIPYTGNSSQSIYLTGDKVAAKEIMTSYGIPTPEWYHRVFEKKPLNERYIFKPVAEDASVGIGDENLIVINSFEKIKNSICFFENKYGTPFFCERFIEGREFNISIIEMKGKPLILPPAEMIFTKDDNIRFKIVDYESKWDEDSEKYKNSTRTFSINSEDKLLIERLNHISEKCWNIFNLRGYARIDYRVDTDGNPYVLEINANPCLSPDSGFYAAALMYGSNFDKIVMTIVEGAFNDNKKRDISE